MAHAAPDRVLAPGRGSSGPAATVRAITCFPIKSVGADLLTSAVVGSDGILGDRRFAFIETASGHVCSAKNPRRFSQMLSCRASYVSEPEAGQPLPPLHVRFPDGSVARQGDGLDDAMSDFLGRSVELIASVPARVSSQIAWDEASGMAKESVYAEATQDEQGDYVATYTSTPRSRTAFVDLTALHLLTTSSLEHFSRLVPDANFDWRRYRPSLLLDTPDVGLVEEGWVGGSLRAPSGLCIEVVMPSPRCVMSAIAHGPEVPEDRRTLRGIVAHNTRDVNGFGRGACLGAYADVAEPGRITVGDVLTFTVGSPDEFEARTSRYRSSRLKPPTSPTKGTTT